jgi:hypothetical protein
MSALLYHVVHLTTGLHHTTILLHVLFIATYNRTSVQFFNSSCIRAISIPQQIEYTRLLGRPLATALVALPCTIPISFASRFSFSFNLACVLAQFRAFSFSFGRGVYPPPCSGGMLCGRGNPRGHSCLPQSCLIA